MRFPAISTVLCPPPAGAPGRSPVGIWRIRVNAVRRARPSGIGAPFPVLSPPSDLFIGVLTCDATQVIQDATSSNRHCQEPPGLDPTCATPQGRNLDARSPRKESAGNRSNGTVRHRLLGNGLPERIESASQQDMRRGRAANRSGARRVLMLLGHLICRRRSLGSPRATPHRCVFTLSAADQTAPLVQPNPGEMVK